VVHLAGAIQNFVGALSDVGLRCWIDPAASGAVDVFLHVLGLSCSDRPSLPQPMWFLTFWGAELSSLWWDLFGNHEGDDFFNISKQATNFIKSFYITRNINICIKLNFTNTI
jgi:hypothetical protein